jgi:hypothetical protein
MDGGEVEECPMRLSEKTFNIQHSTLNFQGACERALWTLDVER